MTKVNMNEKMATAIIEAVDQIRLYDQEAVSRLVRTLIMTPESACRFLGLGEEFQPYAQDIADMVKARYKKNRGKELYETLPIEHFPDSLRSAFGEEKAIMIYVMNIVGFFLEHNSEEYQEKARVLLSRSDKENLFCGGLALLGFKRGEIEYLKRLDRFPEAIFLYYSEKLQKKVEENNPKPKSQLVKEFYRLADLLLKRDEEAASLIKELEKVEIKMDDIIKYRPAIKIACDVIHFDMPKAVTAYYEFIDRTAQLDERYEAISKELKECGFDINALVSNRHAIEPTLEILSD